MPPSYLLTAAASDFRLPIGGGLQNIRPPKNISGGDHQLEGGSNWKWKPKHSAGKKAFRRQSPMAAEENCVQEYFSCLSILHPPEEKARSGSTLVGIIVIKKSYTLWKMSPRFPLFAFHFEFLPTTPHIELASSANLLFL